MQILDIFEDLELYTLFNMQIFTYPRLYLWKAEQLNLFEPNMEHVFQKLCETRVSWRITPKIAIINIASALWFYYIENAFAEDSRASTL